MQGEEAWQHKWLAFPASSAGLPRWLSGKELACQCRSCGFDPWIRKIPWRRKWQLSTVFLPGQPHEQRSPEGYIVLGSHKASDTAEHASLFHEATRRWIGMSVEEWTPWQKWAPERLKQSFLCWKQTWQLTFWTGQFSVVRGWYVLHGKFSPIACPYPSDNSSLPPCPHLSCDHQKCLQTLSLIEDHRARWLARISLLGFPWWSGG